MIDCKGFGPKQPHELTLWDEEKKEFILFKCSEKTYNELTKAIDDYKRKNDTSREPYLILKKRPKGEGKVDREVKM
jgi:hypothetical protein